MNGEPVDLWKPRFIAAATKMLHTEIASALEDAKQGENGKLNIMPTERWHE
jgi:hypothetical protein